MGWTFQGFEEEDLVRDGGVMGAVGGSAVPRRPPGTSPCSILLSMLDLNQTPSSFPTKSLQTELLPPWRLCPM